MSTAGLFWRMFCPNDLQQGLLPSRISQNKASHLTNSIVASGDGEKSRGRGKGEMRRKGKEEMEEKGTQAEVRVGGRSRTIGDLL